MNEPILKTFEHKWHMEFGHPNANKYYSWANFNSKNRCVKCGLHSSIHGTTYVNGNKLILCHGDDIPLNAVSHIGE